MNWFGRLLKLSEEGVLTAPPAAHAAPAPLPVATPEPNPAPVAPQVAAPAAPLNVVVDVTKNQYGSYFLVLSGDTFALNKKVNLGRTGMGFNWFGAKKQWSKKLELLTPQDIQALEAAGANLAVLQQPEYQQLIGARLQAQPDENAPKTPASEQIQKFRDELDKAAGNAAGSERVKAIVKMVEGKLDQLAASVDEAAKQDFIRSFLQFSGKFWQYSWHNQLLIFMQRRDATYCRGPRQWEKMGRRVVNPQNGISILSPRFPKGKEEKDDQQAMGGPVGGTSQPGGQPPLSKMQLTGKMPGRPMFFVPVEIFDISDTEAIAGWKDPETGAGPFEGKPPLKTNPNEPSEHVDTLVHAASTFAKEVGIDLNLDKELPDDLGGYSEGGKVTVNNHYKGVNQFSTLVHELAHEVLHQNAKSQVSNEDLKSLGEFLAAKGFGDRVYRDLISGGPWDEQTMINHIARGYSREVAMAAVRWSKQRKEIDAESAAYIVLHHFGLDTKDAPNYLALWQANSQKVRERRDNITKAVQTIIGGIESNMHDSVAPQPQDNGGMMAQASAANWYLRARGGVKPVNPTVGTNFSNWFNSSTGNGWGSLPQGHGKKKKDNRPTGHPAFTHDGDDHDFED